jgi:hypothetical protein
VTPAPRPSPFGATDHAAAAIVLACAGTAVALATGAGMLAGWWAWHGSRLALGAMRPAHARRASAGGRRG